VQVSDVLSAWPLLPRVVPTEYEVDWATHPLWGWRQVTWTESRLLGCHDTDYAILEEWIFSEVSASIVVVIFGENEAVVCGFLMWMWQCEVCVAFAAWFFGVSGNLLVRLILCQNVGTYSYTCVQKRPNFLNSAPTSTEGALPLLSAPSSRFWQQTAICPVSLLSLVVKLHPLNWARTQAVPRINPTNSLQEAFQQWKKRWERCIASRGNYFEGDSA
jgi:hypothetical protein